MRLAGPGITEQHHRFTGIQVTTSGQGGQLRQLVARARGWALDTVHRGRLITRQLMTAVAADYPFPDQVQVIRLLNGTCLVTTESMIWQQGDHVRQELMDGTVVLVQNDCTRGRVYYWLADGHLLPGR